MVACSNKDCNFYSEEQEKNCEVYLSQHQSILGCHDYNIHNLQLLEDATTERDLYREALKNDLKTFRRCHDCDHSKTCDPNAARGSDECIELHLESARVSND